MPLIYQHRIYRRDLQANLLLRYAFGDNVVRAGMGGQAAEMRGEPNAIGISTKWNPHNWPNSFFSDEYFEAQKSVIDRDLDRVRWALKEGRIVVFPLDGFGTGLSQLPERSPKTWDYLQIRLRELV